MWDRPAAEGAPGGHDTWEEWRAEHPATSVLSLDNGHERDYKAAWRAFWFGWYAQFPETLLFK